MGYYMVDSEHLLGWHRLRCGQTQVDQIRVSPKMRRLLRSLVVLVLISLKSVSTESDILPKNFDVSLYELELHTIPGNGVESSTFEGTLVMSATPQHNIQSITLHARDLVLDKVVRVERKDTGKKVPVSSVGYDNSREIVDILMTESLLQNVTYKVTLAYTGQYGGPSGLGLRRVKCTSRDRDSWVAAFRPGPTSARRVFPCVDQADQMVSLRLKVWRPSDYIAVSNAALESTETISSTVRKDTFETTSPMPPHQFALVVGAFQIAANFCSATVYARTEVLEDVQFAANAVEPLVRALENYTDHPLPCCEPSIVALPYMDDVGSAPGLVGLSESSFSGGSLFVPPAAAQTALLSLAREMVNPQLYGRMKPKDWGQLWVLSGLSAHLQYNISAKVQPSWRLQDQQLNDQLLWVLDEGSRSSARPLEQQLLTGQEIRSALDPVMTAKGAAVLRMLEHSLNFTVFREGVRRFFAASSDSLVAADDLYDALDRESDYFRALQPGVTVVNILQSWARHAGYPVVTVIRDYQNGVAKFTQERFYAMRRDRPEGGSSEEWWVPISLGSRYDMYYKIANSTPTHWIVPGENGMEVELLRDDPGQFIYVNFAQSGLYRVNYDFWNWKLLTEQLLDPLFERVFPPASRAQLLGDALALARAQLLDWGLALDITAYLVQEGDLLPWAAAHQEFLFLSDRLAATSALPMLNSYLVGLLKNVFLDAVYDLGVPAQHDQLVLRETVYAWACDVGYVQCLRHADKMYRNWVANETSPPAEMTFGVLCTAVRLGTAREWLHALRLLQGTQLAQLRQRYIKAMACTTATNLLVRMLESAVADDGPFCESELLSVFSAVIGTYPTGWSAVALFLQERHERIFNINRAGYVDVLENILLRLASKAATDEDLKKVLDLCQRVQGWLGPSEKLEEAAKEAERNIDWTWTNRDSIADWLLATVGREPEPVPTTTTDSAATATSASSSVSVSNSPAPPSRPTSPKSDPTTSSPPTLSTSTNRSDKPQGCVSLLAVCSLMCISSALMFNKHT